MSKCYHMGIYCSFTLGQSLCTVYKEGQQKRKKKNTRKVKLKLMDGFIFGRYVKSF